MRPSSCATKRGDRNAYLDVSVRDVPFSIVMPVRNEAEYLRQSLPACYKVGPQEVLLCLDDPPHEETVRQARLIAEKLGFADRTRFETVARNPEYSFHQAWVRREGFRRAKHDRILTTDADLVINGNVLKAVGLVGRDDVGLVSCAVLRFAKGPVGFWRATTHYFARFLTKAGIAGLYALWRPHWLDSEDDAISRLPDPRGRGVEGSLVLMGEDIHLYNCMKIKHRCAHVSDICAYNLRADYNERPSIQFEVGRYYAQKRYPFWNVLLKSLALARFHYLHGYFYQRNRREEAPAFDLDTYPFSGAIYIGTRKFWTRSIPMTFEDKPRTYEEKRRFRYELQDYMHGAFRFDTFKGRKVLDIGSGAGIDSAEFIRNGALTVSVDFSSLGAGSTKLLLREAQLDGHVILADARYLPFKSSWFDIVYSFGVMHHIPNVSEAIKEAERVLHHGGIFLGMVYNRDSLLYAYSILYMHGIKEGFLAQGKSEVEIASEFSERFPGNPYTKAYSKNELADLLRTCFKRVWVKAYYNVIDMPEKRKTKLIIDSDKGDLGWHLIFKALKW